MLIDSLFVFFNLLVDYVFICMLCNVSGRWTLLLNKHDDDDDDD